MTSSAGGEPGSTSAVTVDVGATRVDGHVGVVTQLLAERRFDRAGAMALLCGPEIMMRFSGALARRPGRRAGERSGCRWSATCSAASAMCGHCQLGPYLLLPGRAGRALRARWPAELITESER